MAQKRGALELGKRIINRIKSGIKKSKNKHKKGHTITKSNGVHSLPDTTKAAVVGDAIVYAGAKTGRIAPEPASNEERAATPAASPAASHVVGTPPPANSQPHLPYSHYYGGAYGNRGRSAGGSTPYAGGGTNYPATIYKSAKERAWDDHRDIRKKVSRPVNMNEAGMQTLLGMLTYARPHSSTTEQDFINHYIVPIPGCLVDDFGNYWVTVGKDPRILWSSHTDTVHRKAGPQKIVVGDGIVTAKDNNCLGADCTAGVWIMTEMIKAKVPGLYIFHRQEEVGGRGSSFIAKNYSKDLEVIDAAIAFDRRGLNDIITRQGDMCASDAFANSVANLLNGPHLSMKPCPNGVFTDTANYTEIIAECTNLSVGYFSEHQSGEFLSLGHLFALRDAVIKAKWSKLVIQRKPGEGSEAHNWRRGRSYSGTTSTYTPPATNVTTASGGKTELERLEDFCRLFSKDVALVLDGMNVSVDDLLDMVALLEDNKVR